MKHTLLLIFILTGVSLGQTNYVALEGLHVPPFTNWLTAATNIQDAVDVAQDGDVVLVMTGAYASGGRPAPGQSLTNRLVVTKPITVQSVFGPQHTIIAGAPDPVLTNGPQAVRGVYLANGATLSGFTITRGHTMATGEDDRCGGGVFMMRNAILSNGYVLSNCSYYEGGGVRATNKCLIHTCRLAYNTMKVSGGSGACVRDKCTVAQCEIYENGPPSLAYYIAAGLASFDSTITECLIYSNYAPAYPAAVLVNSEMTRCRIGAHCWSRDNVWLINSSMCSTLISDLDGGILTFYGVAMTSMIAGCTLVGRLGGILDGILANTIVSASSGENIAFERMHIVNCCAPFTNGIGTISGDPLFRDAGSGDFRLRRDSPCINAGTNMAELGAWDVAGQPRVRGFRVDIGAYEFSTTGACIAVTERVMDFGNVVVGDTATNAVRVVNLGDEPVIGTATGATAPFAILAGAAYMVQSDTYHDVALTFTPLTEGMYSNTLLLQGGGGDEALLIGAGIPEPSAHTLLSFVAGLLLLTGSLSSVMQLQKGR